MWWDVSKRLMGKLSTASQILDLEQVVPMAA
jgi:hypothetical protein